MRRRHKGAGQGPLQPRFFQQFELVLRRLHIRAKVEDEHSSALILVLDMLVKAYVRVGMFDEAIDALFQIRRQEFVPHIMSCNFFDESFD